MKNLLGLFMILLSLTMSGQTPMYTTDALPVDKNYILSNKGTKSVIIIDNTGKKIKEWLFDDPVTGLCVSKGIVYVTSSYSYGWLTSIDMGTGKVGFKTETGMGARSPIINKDGSRIYVFNQF
ncbi:MAG: hypothetical protein ABFD10_13365, partial [Prolixibacteraceae bacterium]